MLSLLQESSDYDRSTSLVHCGVKDTTDAASAAAAVVVVLVVEILCHSELLKGTPSQQDHLARTVGSFFRVTSGVPNISSLAARIPDTLSASASGHGVLPDTADSWDRR